MKPKFARDYVSGVFWLALLVLVTTIGGEIYAPLKTLLGQITGHHWVTKSVLSFLVFFIVVCFSREKESSIQEELKASMRIFWYIVISSILLFAYFFLHFYLA